MQHIYLNRQQLKMMPPTSEVISLTTIEPELFQNDEGKFPTLITLVTAYKPDDIVTAVLNRMDALFTEYHKTNPNDLTVIVDSASHIKDTDGDIQAIITPDTLVLLLDYGADSRMITLQLGTSPNDFTVH